MNIPASSLDTHIRDICAAMRSFGRNKSRYPFDLAFHSSKWWVTVELDTAKATVEFEASDPDPLLALASALARLRREARLCGISAQEQAAA